MLAAVYSGASAIVFCLSYGGKISTFHQKPSKQFLVFYKTMQLLLWFIQLIYIY